MGWAESSMWNGILVFTETLVLTLCTGFFLSRTEQNVNSKKKYRCILVFVYWSGLAGITFGIPYDWYVNLILLAYMVFMTVITGFWLYNRRSIYRFYYFLFPVTLVTAEIFVVYMVFSYMSSRWGVWVFDYSSANTALIIKQLTEVLLTGVWVVLLNRKKYENVKGIWFAGLFLPPVVSIFITQTSHLNSCPKSLITQRFCDKKYFEFPLRNF